MIIGIVKILFFPSYFIFIASCWILLIYLSYLVGLNIQLPVVLCYFFWTQQVLVTWFFHLFADFQCFFVRLQLCLVSLRVTCFYFIFYYLIYYLILFWSISVYLCSSCLCHVVLCAPCN